MFYFKNTPYQKKGDAAYNATNYNEALRHYEDALEAMNKVDTSRLKSKESYWDEKLYLITEIVITISEELRVFLGEDVYQDIQPEIFAARIAKRLDPFIEKKYQRIHELLHIIEELRHKINSDRKTTHKNIIKMYELLCARSHTISDIWADTIENKNLDAVIQARSWLDKAIQYGNNGNLQTPIQTHFNVLYFLQYQYEITQKISLLNALHDYIQKHNLATKTLAWNDQLELKTYQLFCAVKLGDPAMHQHASACQTILDEHHDALNGYGELVNEIKELRTQIPQKVAPPLKPNPIRLQGSNFLTLFHQSTEIKTHFNFLYLLQCRYHLNRDSTLLDELHDYIQEHDLTNKTLTWNEQLELNMYQLFYAVKTKNPSMYQHEKNCKIIMEAHRNELDVYDDFIEKIEALRKEIPPKASSPRRHPASSKEGDKLLTGYFKFYYKNKAAGSDSLLKKRSHSDTDISENHLRASSENAQTTKAQVSMISFSSQ